MTAPTDRIPDRTTRIDPGRSEAAGWPSMLGYVNAWRDWLVNHGFDPSEWIPVGAAVCCYDTARQVTCTVVQRDGVGQLLADRDGHRALALCTIQLESPALPFPEPPRPTERA